MGRAIWIGVKFLVGLGIGTLIGAVTSAYAAGAGDPSEPGAGMGFVTTRDGIKDRMQARLSAARAAGEAAAMQTEASLTQQFRAKVHDPAALNP